ncbi:MAG: hypothetical protein ACKVJG_12645 [Candidatus Latescibacterota bacterium]
MHRTVADDYVLDLIISGELMGGYVAVGAALIVVATAAYFYHWDTVPDGYYTDAASNMLNALCISHTGADEYGRFLPTTIRAFDDYRPPLLIYLFSIGNFLHPLTVASARLMSMVLGWGALFLFLIVYIKRFPLPVIHWPIFYPLLFGLVLCSSWVLIPHRMPVEYVTTLPVTLLLLLSSWRWIQEPDSHRAALVSALSTGLMLYAYSGTKPIAFTQVPVLFAVHFFYHRRLPKPAYIYLAMWGFLVAPTLIDLLTGGEVSLSRYRAVGGANPFEVVAAFLQHLGHDFLFFEGDRNWRHHTGLGGMLNIALLPLAVAGGIALCKEVFLRRNAFWIFITLFLVTALLPVSLTREGLPHAIRALPAVIPLIMVLILGFASIENFLRDRNDQIRSSRSSKRSTRLLAKNAILRGLTFLTCKNYTPLLSSTRGYK